MYLLPPLYDGKIVSRYKRFLADVVLDCGEEVTAHCPNTGAMTGCWEPGAAVQLSSSDNPKRKLKWTLERIDMGSGWIGVNTSRVNKIIQSFISHGSVKLLAGYDNIQSEPAYSPHGFHKSRLDLLLKGNQRRGCYVEIKNATMVQGNNILFPDSVTKRGKKHLQLLQQALVDGFRSVIIFAVNRPEGTEFAIASDIDPDYHDALIEAHASGVEIIALRIRHREEGVEAGEALPVLLN